jgi:hypothetical protein
MRFAFYGRGSTEDQQDREARRRPLHATGPARHTRNLRAHRMAGGVVKGNARRRRSTRSENFGNCNHGRGGGLTYREGRAQRWPRESV